jgi:hypothetical protein
MKRLVLASFAALGLLAAAAPGHAQFIYTPPATSPFYRPALSPYLNLALPGNRAINYFGLVQPQIQTANQLGLLQGQLLQQQGLLGNGLYGGYGAYGGYGYGYGYPGAGVLSTGYGAGFQNHWAYFQNWRTGTAALGPGFLAGEPGAGLTSGVGLNPGAGYFGTGTTGFGIGISGTGGRTQPAAPTPMAPQAPQAPKPR